MLGVLAGALVFGRGVDAVIGAWVLRASTDCGVFVVTTSFDSVKATVTVRNLDRVISGNACVLSRDERILLQLLLMPCKLFW